MNNKLKVLSILLVTLLMTGCYHAKITTGEEASNQIYENKWAVSWIGGLIPPEAVNAENQCQNGVAMVETRHSFLNMLVGGLTAGIFTPMEITVTCAGSGTAFAPTNENPGTISISDNALEEELIRGLQQAAEQSFQTGKPVFVSF